MINFRPSPVRRPDVPTLGRDESMRDYSARKEHVDRMEREHKHYGEENLWKDVLAVTAIALHLRRRVKGKHEADPTEQLKS